MQNICIKTLFSRPGSGVTCCSIFPFFSFLKLCCNTNHHSRHPDFIFHAVLQWAALLLLQDASNKFPKIMLNHLWWKKEEIKRRDLTWEPLLAAAHSATEGRSERQFDDHDSKQDFSNMTCMSWSQSDWSVKRDKLMGVGFWEDRFEKKKKITQIQRNIQLIHPKKRYWYIWHMHFWLYVFRWKWESI